VGAGLKGHGVMPTEIATGSAGCAYCLWRFVDTPHDPTVECEYCQTPYHVECFEENSGCVTFGCPAWMAAQRGEPLPPLTTAVAPSPLVVGLGAEEVESTENETWFCTHCGHRISQGDAFCDQCGTDLRVTA
jgi:DNA-directed RNA polymerase subunit RPC12/RpoP